MVLRYLLRMYQQLVSNLFLRPLPLALIALGMVLAGCRDDEPLFPIEPRVAFVSFSADTVPELESFIVTLSYTDGDGDLGSDDNNAEELLLVDNRPNVPFQIDDTTTYEGRFVYSIPNLTPETRNPSIQGEISIDFPGLTVLEPFENEYETVQFRVTLEDRAGNVSPEIVTPPIVVARGF